MTSIIQKDPSDYVPEIVITSIPIGASSDTTIETVGDAVFQNITFEEPYFNYTISVPLDQATISVTSLSPATFEMDGLIAERVAANIGRVCVDFGTYKVIRKLDFRSSTGDYTTRRLSGFTEGTVGNYTLTAATEKLSAGGEDHYYNGSSYASCIAQPGGIQRNLGCWGADYDFSGVPISYLYNNFNGGGVLVTPRHLIVTNHYEPRNKVGDTIRFLGSNGTVYLRAILAQTTGSELGGLTNSVTPVGDLCMFLLDVSLPADVVVYPVAGDWIVNAEPVGTSGANYLYDIEWSGCFITIDQQRRVRFSITATRFTDFSVPANSEISVGGVLLETKPWSSVLFKSSIYDEYGEFQSNAVVGDSGSPVFVEIGGNDLAIVTLMTYPDRGTLIYGDLVNAMILEVDARAGISTGFTCTVVTDPQAEFVTRELAVDVEPGEGLHTLHVYELVNGNRTSLYEALFNPESYPTTLSVPISLEVGRTYTLVATISNLNGQEGGWSEFTEPLEVTI